jgi:rRNA maturation RNase YbeY
LTIRFHEENKKKQIKNKKIIREWIKEEILRRKKTPGEINIILTSDEYLRNLNWDYLKRDYYTDIISFDYSKGIKISGDLFVSIDRVEENAVSYNVSYEKELIRVIIHGILHIMGYMDDTKSNKKLMREEENNGINNYENIRDKRIKLKYKMLNDENADKL